MTRWPRSVCTLTTGAANEFSRITHMMKPVETSSIASPSACSAMGEVGAVHALVEPDRDEPDQRRHAEYQHEFLVGGGLLVLHRRAHALGEQRRIGPGQPQSADSAEHDHGRQEHPCRRPVQRAGGHEQQRAHRDDPDQVLQHQFGDHAAFPFLGRHDRAVFGKLAASMVSKRVRSGGRQTS